MFDVYWFEEPLWYDDVKGHAQLARVTSIPVALGEQLYTTDAFADFFCVAGDSLGAARCHAHGWLD